MPRVKALTLQEIQEKFLDTGLLGYINHEILGQFGLILALRYDTPDGSPKAFEMVVYEDGDKNELSPELLADVRRKLLDFLTGLDEGGDGPPSDSALRKFANRRE